ncbi:unnamed protein product [Ambrosiozyma monospora]|uniref:Unnamed protein product n=1 Tax=Ambrosiozyma monospora TaxID=43982 RepID=A0ACB5T8E7_AMBMO|nr:unnamed protein product [Ambrosiozyma monospora]
MSNSDKVSRRVSIAHWTKPSFSSALRPPKKKVDPGNVNRRFSVRPSNQNRPQQFNLPTTAGRVPLPLPSHLHPDSGNINNIVRHENTLDPKKHLRQQTTKNDPHMPSKPKKPRDPNTSDQASVSTTSTSNTQKQLMQQQQQQQMAVYDPNALLLELSKPTFDANTYLKQQLANADSENLDKFTQNVAELQKANEFDVKYTINQSFNQVLILSDSVSQTVENLNDLRLKLDKLTSNLSTSQQSQDGSSASSGGPLVTTYDSKKWAQLERASMKAIRLLQVNVEHDTLSVITRRSLRKDRNAKADETVKVPVANVTVSILKEDVYNKEFVLTIKLDSARTSQSFLKRQFIAQFEIRYYL